MTNPFKKKLAVGNMGEEELEQLQRITLTRDDTRAEADLLFGGAAKDMRKADRGMLEKLFVQTPASVTMAPNLQKNASKDEPYSKGERAALLAGALGTGATAANEARHLLRGTESKHGYLGYLAVPAAVAGVAIKRRLQGKKAFPTSGSAIHAGGKSKTSSVDMLKLAMSLACGPDGGDNWLTQFEASPLMAQAIALEEQSLQAEQEDIQSRIEDQARYSQQDQERNAKYQKGDQIRLQKRVLALELAKEKAGLGAQQEEAPEEMPPEGMEHEEAEQAAVPQEAPPQAPPGAQKTASVTAHVDAFFEKLSAPTDAQRRYPELLKVAGGAGTVKVPNIKPRVTTETSGPTPTRSSLSGGSA